MSIHFLAPEFLLLLLGVPVLLYWPRRPVGVPVAILRALILSSIVMALAQPVREDRDGDEYRVYILDRSQSVALADQQQALEFLQQQVSQRSSGTQLFVVGFGGELGEVSAELSGWQQEFNAWHWLGAAPEQTSRRSLGQSPLAAAYAWAGRQIPLGARGSILTLSDGQATDLHWNREVATLTARGIVLHAVELAAEIQPLRLLGLSCASELAVGTPGRLDIDVQANEGTVQLRLLKGEQVLAETVATVGASRRALVQMEFEPHEAGFISLSVEATSGESRDRFTQSFAVQDPLRVLYLGERVVDSAPAFAQLVGPGFQLEVPTGDELPPLINYDLIVLDDVPEKNLDDQLQEQLVSAVTGHGVGLYACGGSAAFGPGGYHESPLEHILPVEFMQKQEKKDPSTALVLIIDTSGSMGGQRVQLAKEISRLSMRRLLPHDKIGIVEFFGNKRWAAPLQSAANKINIQRALNRLDVGGGTVIMPAIEEAYYGLKNVQTRYKHVLVLTDGGVEAGAFEPLVRRMAKDSITVSTVLVGPGRHSEFLVEIADWGRGRYYHVPNRFNLPELIIKQPSSAKLPAYRPGVHRVSAKGGLRWWGEIETQDMPTLDGYVETRLRSRAEVVLETVKDRHPVVASWRYGAGRITALMTEPTGSGTESWRDWPGFGAMLARQLKRTALHAPAYEVRFRREGDQLSIVVHSLAGQGPPASANLISRETTLALVLAELAPGWFQAKLEWPREQEIRLELAADRGRSLRFVDRAASDVSQEQQVKPEHVLPAQAIAKRAGGEQVSIDEASTRNFSVAAGAPLSFDPLWPQVLAAALICYLIEILLRRSSWRRVEE